MRLQAKLFLLFAALLLGAAAAVNGVNYRRATKDIGRRLMAEQKDKLEALAAASAPALVTGNDLALVDYAKIVRPLNENAAWAEVILADGTVVAHTDPAGIGRTLPVPPPLEEEAGVLQQSVTRDGKTYGWVRMAVDPARIAAAESGARGRARESAVYAFVLVLAAGLPLAWLAAAAAVSPLRRLTSRMQRISEGHLDERVGTGRRDEIGDLGRQVDLMLEMLAGGGGAGQEGALKLAHDLKSPLAAIRTYLDVVSEKAGPNAPAREDIESIKASADRLSGMIEDVLERKKIQEGRAEPVLYPVDLGDALKKVWRMHRIEAEQKGVRLLEPGLPYGMPGVLSRPEHLQRLLDNLLTNALKYTDAGGTVWVEVDIKGPEVWVMVNDTGIGIEPDRLPGLFRRFERGPSEEVSERSGVGLGLFIAKELVELHGGRIWAVSRGKGSGATFVFTLKAVFDEEPAEEAAA